MQSLSRRSSSHSCSNNHTCTRPPPSAALLLLLRHGSSNCSTLSRPQQQQQHHQQRSSLQRVHAEKVTERELQMKLAIASSTDRLVSQCFHFGCGVAPHSRNSPRDPTAYLLLLQTPLLPSSPLLPPSLSPPVKQPLHIVASQSTHTALPPPKTTGLVRLSVCRGAPRSV